MVGASKLREINGLAYRWASNVRAEQQWARRANHGEALRAEGHDPFVEGKIRGDEDRRALAALIGESSIACEERDRDRYGRVVSVCSIAGIDLNGRMVGEGWAFAYRRYSNAYIAEKSGARAAGWRRSRQ